jgi:hypothetical protein
MVIYSIGGKERVTQVNIAYQRVASSLNTNCQKFKSKMKRKYVMYIIIM